MNDTIQVESDLGRSMPPLGSMFRIPHEEHNVMFYTYTATDVWTADGWLVTAIQDDGITIHGRKGKEVCVRKVKRDTDMFVVVDPETLYNKRFGMSRSEVLELVNT